MDTKKEFKNITEKILERKNNVAFLKTLLKKKDLTTEMLTYLQKELDVQKTDLENQTNKLKTLLSKKIGESSYKAIKEEETEEFVQPTKTNIGETRIDFLFKIILQSYQRYKHPVVSISEKFIGQHKSASYIHFCDFFEAFDLQISGGLFYKIVSLEEKGVENKNIFS